MEHYIIHNPHVNLYSALVDTVAMAVRDGVFKNRGTIQNHFSDNVHWLIRSIEIKDHEHLVEVYKDILLWQAAQVKQLLQTQKINLWILLWLLLSTGNSIQTLLK